jgi:hypothetical protein
MTMRHTAGMRNCVHTYICIYVMHSTDPQFCPSDHMMWNTSSVHLPVTERMHGVSAYMTFRIICVLKGNQYSYCLYSDHKNTILETCSGTLCKSLVCKLHYLLLHDITFHVEETMITAGISCRWCFQLSSSV